MCVIRNGREREANRVRVRERRTDCQNQSILFFVLLTWTASCWNMCRQRQLDVFFFIARHDMEKEKATFSKKGTKQVAT